MYVGTKPERPTARSLLTNAVDRDSGPEDIAQAVDRAFAALLVGLGRWVGDDSARVLLERSLDETRTRHPWLVGVRVVPEAHRCLAGLDERIAGLSGPQVAEGLEELLTELIGLLSKFIGNDLALRIVVRAWPAGPPAAERGEPR